MEEFVQITLDHYHNLLKDSKKSKKLYEVFEELRNIVDDEKFIVRYNNKDQTNVKIFKLYSKIYEEIK